MKIEDELKQVLKDYEAKTKKKVNLFVALQMDELTGKWSIFTAADWINDSNRQEVFKKMIDILEKNMANSRENLSTIARLAVFNSEDYLAKQLLDTYKSNDSATGDRLNGGIIHESLIIRSNKRGK